MSAIISRQVDRPRPFFDHIVDRLDGDRLIPLPASKQIIAISWLNLFQIIFNGFMNGLVDNKYIVFAGL